MEDGDDKNIDTIRYVELDNTSESITDESCTDENDTDDSTATPMSPGTETYDDSNDESDLPDLRIYSFQDLNQIIMVYGTCVFEGMKTPISLLEFIVEKIIPVTNKLYNRSFEYNVVKEFIRIMRDTARVDSVSDINRGKLMVRGTFGNIYESALNNT